MAAEIKLCAGAWGFRQVEIPACLDVCARLGMKYAELNLSNDPKVLHLRTKPAPGALAELARSERQSGVKVVCVCAGNDFTNLEGVAESVAATRRAIDVTADVGASVIRLFAGWMPFERLREQHYRRCADALREVGGYAQGKGVLVAMENHGGPTATAAQVLRLLEMADHPNVKANFDGGNFAHCREDPLAAYRVLRGRIGYTHWKDVRVVDGELGYCALGDGITDWAPVVRALLADGYDGYWTMEYEEPADVEAGMAKCIEVVRSAGRAGR